MKNFQPMYGENHSHFILLGCTVSNAFVCLFLLLGHTWRSSVSHVGCQGANLGNCAQGKHPPHPFSTVDGQVSGPLPSSKPLPTQDGVPSTVSTIVLRNQTRSQYSCAERGAVRKAPHRISRKGAQQFPRVRVLLFCPRLVQPTNPSSPPGK